MESKYMKLLHLNSIVITTFPPLFPTIMWWNDIQRKQGRTMVRRLRSGLPLLCLVEHALMATCLKLQIWDGTFEVFKDTKPVPGNHMWNNVMGASRHMGLRGHFRCLSLCVRMSQCMAATWNGASKLCEVTTQVDMLGANDVTSASGWTTFIRPLGKVLNKNTFCHSNYPYYLLPTCNDVLWVREALLWKSTLILPGSSLHWPSPNTVHMFRIHVTVSPLSEY